MRLLVQDFIAGHPDWERLLQGKPYCLAIQRDTALGRDLVLLKYDQTESDFSEPLVRECRGLILDAHTFEPVCVPFFKFFNSHEEHAARIDWTTASTQEKVDGSLIKVVRLGDGLLVSTNGTIDAYKARVQDQIGFVGKSFGDIFDMALENAYRDNYPEEGVSAREWLKGLLDEGVTYMFELTSPMNVVVVHWKETRLTFLGSRDNATMGETGFFGHPLSSHFHTPRMYPLRTLADVVAASEALGDDEEGFVVCDAAFNRIKVKSKTYVMLHSLANNHVMTYERAVDIIRNGQCDDVLSYFPEFRESVGKVDIDIHALERRLLDAWTRFQAMRGSLPTRKEQAAAIMSEGLFGRLHGIGFSLLDGKAASPREWIMSAPVPTLLRALGYSD